jgi:hypothetical protein
LLVALNCWMPGNIVWVAIIQRGFQSRQQGV